MTKERHFPSNGPDATVSLGVSEDFGYEKMGERPCPSFLERSVRGGEEEGDSQLWASQ